MCLIYATKQNVSYRHQSEKVTYLRPTTKGVLVHATKPKSIVFYVTKPKYVCLTSPSKNI